MKAKKLCAALLSLMLVVGGLSGCGGGGGDNAKVEYDDGYGENVLRITYDHECESGDVRQTTGDYIIPMNCFDTLVQTVSTDDGSSEIQPCAAEKWEVSPDGLTYTMHLRKGIKFTNGEEMTSDDVLYTVDSMLDPERATMNYYWMDMLAGAKDVLDGKAKSVEGKGIIIHDDYTFDIVLEDSYAPFLSTLSVPAWVILNREACDEGDKAGKGKKTTLFGSEPEYTVGSGPFILKEWVLNDHIYLEANKDYWQGAPKIDGILIKVVTDTETEKMLFESGQTDIFDLDNDRSLIPTYRDDADWSDNMVSKVIMGGDYLVINENIEPLNDVKVRKALQKAIDRQAIIDSLYEGTGTLAKGIFPPTLVCYNDQLPDIEYDPEGAKELLKEAGYENGFKMTLAKKATDKGEALEAIQDQLKEVGIEVEIESVDEASYYDIRGNGELASHEEVWWADFNDPDNFLYTYFATATTKERSINYYNKDIIKRVEAARHMSDEDARMKEYLELEKQIIVEDAAFVPLWHTEKIRLVQDRVKGFIPHWAGWGDCSYYSVELDAAE